MTLNTHYPHLGLHQIHRLEEQLRPPLAAQRGQTQHRVPALAAPELASEPDSWNTSSTTDRHTQS